MNETTETNEEWGVIYMPATQGEDPSRSGFKTEDEANKYMRRYWCKDCRREYAKALRWKRKGVDVCKLEDEMDTLEIVEEKEYWKQYDEFQEKYGAFDPTCSYEWIVDKAEDLDAIESTEDMMKFIGYKPEGEMK